MPPSDRPHLRDGVLSRDGRKWTPKKNTKPQRRGTTHKRTRKPPAHAARIAAYNAMPRASFASVTAFVPLDRRSNETRSIGNERGEHSVRARKTAQQRAVFAALCELGVRPELPVAIVLTRVTLRQSRMDQHAEWHKHIVDECARWAGVDDGDERITWSFRHGVGDRKGVQIVVRTRTAEMERALEQIEALRKAVGL